MKITYSSTLPKELFEDLEFYSKKMKLPKNQIIERSLQAYIEKIKKAEYAASFRRANKDKAHQTLADTGLEDYLKILDNIN
ncbi:MAG: CopG family transcriptional regulator [Bacteroidota bacterium]